MIDFGRTKQLWEEEHFNNDNFDYEHDSGDQRVNSVEELLDDLDKGEE